MPILLAAAMSPESEKIWGVSAVVVIGIAAVAYLIFFISALISILASRQGCGTKLLWVFVAFAAPFLGPLLWFVVGRRINYDGRSY
ncbi:PLD nuclease N-terminal domain-containing protein [Kibdelosporangium philippinense]|uniref:PLD nuclease N-terminal domain-containing protein n=1 Tax=Kibdelosporangium philippinense TaxID=211113 RepID=A0ABS8ZR05_9PSEU|nr:PLD nuclease N-terminal domain-containing protein [Kibdelosporangium philippinense]MCE7010161.1 PLD nuclease N-terminal domain-containing protein [Kibdelosporangium philippinense]